MEITSRYNPSKIESKWNTIWEENATFVADAHSKKKPYTIVIPPPNVTGILTMGHVLNLTIQDILIRYKRMGGYEALWVPGTDHAGIATQVKIEEKLRKEGKDRKKMGRSAFLKEAWQWKEKFHERITAQMKRLGLSVDWSKERFTLDEGYSNAVLQVFKTLHKQGLIYKGKYIVNYCPRCKTVLSNDEIEHYEEDSYLWYIKYPLEEGGFITVATTRPETMLGDTGIAVNPGDKRYKDYVGRTAILPLLHRRIPIIKDRLVDPEFGSGAVKVTPAHDPIDFEIGKRHNLDAVIVIDEDGKINQNGGPYKGMDRFEAREKIVEDLQKLDMLEKKEPYTHSIGRCYRCGSVIEPELSTQWFVSMKDMAKSAKKVVQEGEIKFYLPRWKKVYNHWLDEVKDWVISRQLWWGHQMPVWYCKECNTEVVSKDKPEKCPKCGGKKFRQDPDVLDTWFSSWLWPFVVMGWDEKTDMLKKFFPTDTLVTGWDIIFLWVARMVMASLKFTGKIPFKNVYFTGMVRDEKRRKLSKSLGNSPDPIDLIDEYGADSVRMGMMLITPEGQDVIYSKSRIEIGRNLANKIWNAGRFILLNVVEGDKPNIEDISLETVDRWIISQTESTIKEVSNAIDNFRINDGARLLYDKFWHIFCDWYIEMVKPRIFGEDEYAKRSAISITLWVFDNFLKLLHPFMPFITEELWSYLPGKENLLTISEWPVLEKNLIDKQTEEKVEFLREVIDNIRNIRGEYKIDKKMKIPIYIKGDEDRKKLIKEELEWVSFLTGLGEIQKDINPNIVYASSVLKDIEIYVPLGELIDIKQEIKRQEKELRSIVQQSDIVRKRLNNREFLDKAPSDVLENAKDKLRFFEDKIEKINHHLTVLKSK